MRWKNDLGNTLGVNNMFNIRIIEKGQLDNEKRSLKEDFKNYWTL